MSSVCYAAEKTVKSVTRKCIRNLFLNFSRSKNSRYLGYYMRKLPCPDYWRRKEEYRKNVLKPLEEIPTLQERLKEMNAPDPVLDAKVDIGFSISNKKYKVSVKDRLLRRKLLAEQKFHLNNKVKIDLSEIHENWQKSIGVEHLQNIAEHYGIFSHLFDHGFFSPCVPLNILYNGSEDSIIPVYMGNVLEASEVKSVPQISFNSRSSDLWTIIFTNLDGHLLDTKSEYLHWFVGNIKGSNLESGQVICDYLQPFPMRGTGYHRLVFVLYKQEKEIDYSSMKRTVPCFSLKERTFKTFDFYKKFQDRLTPAGLAFFQCTWDETLTDFFHHTLNMHEPVFEYVEKPLYYKPQVQYPHLEPFNLYLDRYRDPKEIQKEVLLKRLKTVEPFKEEPPMPKYPCLHKPDNYRFSWQRQDIRLERLRLGKYRGLRPHSIYPQEDNQFPYWGKG